MTLLGPCTEGRDRKQSQQGEEKVEVDMQEKIALLHKHLLILKIACTA